MDDIQATFGLSEEEELMESFICSLAQTYACSYNTFSKPREVMPPASGACIQGLSSHLQIANPLPLMVLRTLAENAGRPMTSIDGIVGVAYVTCCGCIYYSVYFMTGKNAGILGFH